jgi:poly(A) polymerase
MNIFNIHPEEKPLFDKVAEASRLLGYPAYLVGGFVRDRILQRSSKDIDIVCVGSGIEFAKKLASLLSPKPTVQFYENFGTAAINYQGLEIELVGARRESYRNDSRKPLVENGSLEDDLSRRDFTINALAVSLNEGNYGEVIDLFNGLEDIKNKVIRTPLDPQITFSDDPLRMMRAIRFATQLHFIIQPDTLKAIQEQPNRIKIISQERIITELQKIMQSIKPSIGYKLLFETELLAIIFPELNAMSGIEIKNDISHKDNFLHSIQVLDKICLLTDNIWLRWAALLHDIAKPQTKRFYDNQGWTFYGHEALGALMIPRIFKRMKLPQDQKMKYVQKLVAMHARPVSLSKLEITDSALRRLIVEAGEELEDLIVLCGVDSTSQSEQKRLRYQENLSVLKEKLELVEEKDRLRDWQPPVSGDDIMILFNISPSKTVGILKNGLREAILDGEIKDNREDALIYLQEQAKKLNLL